MATILGLKREGDEENLRADDKTPATYHLWCPEDTIQ